MNANPTRRESKRYSKEFYVRSKMASSAIPVDFVIGDDSFSVIPSTTFVTISINNTLFPILPVPGDQILVAQSFPSALNGLYTVIPTVLPGGVTAVRDIDVPYTVGTRFITRFNQIYAVVSNNGGLIFIRAFDPSDPSLALLLRLVFGIGRNLCCDQPQDCCCEEKKEKKCVYVIKECKKKCKKEKCHKKEKKEKKEKSCECHKKKEKSCGCGCGGH